MKMVNWYAAGLAIALLYILPKRLIAQKIINYYKYGTLHNPTKTVLVILDDIGINFEKARIHAKKGTKIIIGSYNLTKAETAKKELIKLTNNKNIIVMQVNRNDKNSLRSFAADVMESENFIDVLINNKGSELAELDINFRRQELAKERFENLCQNFLCGIPLVEDL